MSSDHDLFELWHHGTIRCLMTPRSGLGPFIVDIYDGVPSHGSSTTTTPQSSAPSEPCAEPLTGAKPSKRNVTNAAGGVTFQLKDRTHIVESTSNAPRHAIRTVSRGKKKGGTR